MGLFKKRKSKKEYSDLSTTEGIKPKRLTKSRFLNVSVVGLAVVLVLVLAVVTYLQNPFNPFATMGLSLDEVKQTFKDLNADFNETELLTGANSPTELDRANLRDKINAGFTPKQSDFGFFTSDGNIILENLLPGMGTKNTTTTNISEQDMAAFLDYVVNAGTFSNKDYTSLLGTLYIKGNVVKTNFSEQDGLLTISFIVKLDLSDLKKALEAAQALLNSFGVNFPNTLYLNCDMVLGIDAINKYSVESAHIALNALSPAKNANALYVLCTLLFGSSSKDVGTISKGFATTAGKTISDLAKGWGADFVFGGNQLNITKSL